MSFRRTKTCPSCTGCCTCSNRRSPRGLRLPIDFFLRSLAQDQQEQSIGVILSGMGSDGTLGLRAIKEKGGRGRWCRIR